MRWKKSSNSAAAPALHYARIVHAMWIKRELVSALGVLGDYGVAQRATFIVDPNGEIQFVYVTAGSVGRNPEEVLRVLDALQTDELCPCNWHKGEETLKVA